MRVAYLRPQATFTHIAAMTYFGSEAAYLPMDSTSVCRSVQHGDAEFGVLPIENLFEGTVGSTLDALYTTADIHICGEIVLPIHHHLLSNEPLEKIKRIYSHDQALRQCQRHLKQLEREAGQEFELIQEESTARGAQRAAHEVNAAAISTDLAARVYGLEVVRPNIEDRRNNATRFWALSRGQLPEPSGSDKTTFLLELENRTGTLVETLSRFNQKHLNLTMIQSRPLGMDARAGRWEYVFFVEYEGHLKDPSLAEVYRVLERSKGILCRRVRVLGSYHQASTPILPKESTGMGVEAQQNPPVYGQKG